MLKKLASLNFSEFLILLPGPDGLVLSNYSRAAEEIEQCCRQGVLVEQESYLNNLDLLADVIFETAGTSD